MTAASLAFRLYPTCWRLTLGCCWKTVYLLRVNIQGNSCRHIESSSGVCVILLGPRRTIHLWSASDSRSFLVVGKVVAINK